MSRSEYRVATVVLYDCGEHEQTTARLEELSVRDKQFARRLQLMPFFYSMLERIVQYGDRLGVAHNGAETVAIVYVKQELYNRARFACMQKHLFVQQYSHVPEATKGRALQRIDAELNYVSCLVENLNCPDMIRAKRNLDHWCRFRPGDGKSDVQPCITSEPLST